MTDTEVLIAGGGPAGLATAVFLARLGVRVVLVERHDGTLLHPRARTINPRTAELLRLAGIEDGVRSASTYQGEMPAVLMLKVETMAGEELSRHEQRPATDASGAAGVSPSAWGMVDQDRLETLLRARAEQLGADVRFGVALTGFRQDDDRVTVTLRRAADRAVEQVTCRYLVGADGHHSTVRELAGIGVDGPGTISRVLSVVFDADLTGPLRGRHDPDRDMFVASCHCTVPAPGTVLFPHGRPGRWVFNTPASGPADEATCAGFVRAAVGVPDLPLALVPQLGNGETILSYEIAAHVATRYRDRRVFLAGDAAHVMPPAGAFGLGTGVQDAHNLAWKLHARLTGAGGEPLLDSYEQERRPVAEFTLGQALSLLAARGGVRVGPTVEPADYDAVVFGYRYRSGVVGDGEPGPPAMPPSELDGMPGTRAPHLWLDADKLTSTLDLYGRRHVLLAGPRADAWVTAARELGLPAYVAGADLTVDPALWGRRHGTGPEGALLIRPDGFVAWRSDPDDDGSAVAGPTLTAALARSTGRAPSILNRQS